MPASGDSASLMWFCGATQKNMATWSMRFKRRVHNTESQVGKFTSRQSAEVRGQGPFFLFFFLLFYGVLRSSSTRR